MCHIKWNICYTILAYIVIPLAYDNISIMHLFFNRNMRKIS